VDNLRPLKRGSTEKKTSECQKNAKVGLGGIGTRIERLNLQLKQGNYYPDLLDEQSALLRERLRHIRK
jgi:hypothetical protein